MKTVIFIFSLLLSFITNAQSPVIDIEMAIRESDFVGIVSYSDENSTKDSPILIVSEGFKADVKYLNVRDVDLSIEEGVEYLLLANEVGGLVTKIKYPITRIGDLSSTVKTILNKMECYSEALKSSHANRFCNRDSDPVCGCDNKTYGNICEMTISGIRRFKPGRCNE